MYWLKNYNCIPHNFVVWGYYGFIGVTAAAAGSAAAAAAAAEISCARSTALSAGQIFSKLYEYVYG